MTVVANFIDTTTSVRTDMIVHNHAVELVLFDEGHNRYIRVSYDRDELIRTIAREEPAPVPEEQEQLPI